MSGVLFHLGTFRAAGSPPFAGLVLADRVIATTALVPLCRDLGQDLREPESVLGLLEHWSHNLPALRAAAEALSAVGVESLPSLPLAALEVLPPVPAPRQIFCSGANYKRHVIELVVAQAGPHVAHLSPEERFAWAARKMDERAATGRPFVFLKAPTAVTGPYSTLRLPLESVQVDWELELGVVIGRPARRVPSDRALEYVAGYVIVNDITARDLVYRPDIPEMGMDWLAAKCAPGFLPMGPYLTPACFVPDPQDLTITLKLNGQVMQHDSTADMIFDVAQLIEHISRYVQLLPGDLICTGSPAGNGAHYNRFLQHGDVLEGTITGLGTQRVRCLDERLTQPVDPVMPRRSQQGRKE